MKQTEERLKIEENQKQEQTLADQEKDKKEKACIETSLMQLKRKQEFQSYKDKTTLDFCRLSSEKTERSRFFESMTPSSRDLCLTLLEEKRKNKKISQYQTKSKLKSGQKNARQQINDRKETNKEAQTHWLETYSSQETTKENEGSEPPTHLSPISKLQIFLPSVASNLSPLAVSIAVLSLPPGELLSYVYLEKKLQLEKHIELQCVALCRLLYTTFDQNKNATFYATAMLVLPSSKNPFFQLNSLPKAKESQKKVGKSREEIKSAHPSLSLQETIVWCHGTTGIHWSCAPSLLSSTNFLMSIPGCHDFLKKGYAILAPDYLGLGLNPNESVFREFSENFLSASSLLNAVGVKRISCHPYLIGESEAKCVLDCMKASLKGPKWNLGNKFFFWGHSEGGHAAIFATQLQKAYAPNLSIQGLALSAPATNLVKLMLDRFSSAAGKIVGAYGVYSWNCYYGDRFSVETLVKSQYLTLVKKISTSCLQGLIESANAVLPTFLIGAEWTVQLPSMLSPWKEALQENSPVPKNISCPVIIFQGEKDVVVTPEITKQWAFDLGLENRQVEYCLYTNCNHFNLPRTAIFDLLAWLEARSQ